MVFHTYQCTSHGMYSMFMRECWHTEIRLHVQYMKASINQYLENAVTYLTLSNLTLGWSFGAIMMINSYMHVSGKIKLKAKSILQFISIS